MMKEERVVPEVFTIISYMILLPLIYGGAILWIRENFEQMHNKERKPFHSIPEVLVLLLSELALFRMWWSIGKKSYYNLTFLLLFVILAALTVLCMTDLWERIVPNKFLLILLLVYFLILGTRGIVNMNEVIAILPSITLGLIFSLITFGIGYFLAKGSMGAGDVKLTLVMGLYLTGEYVVAVILYGCIASALYSVVQLLRKKISRKDAIPFVPFLYIGLIIRYFIG